MVIQYWMMVGRVAGLHWGDRLADLHLSLQEQSIEAREREREREPGAVYSDGVVVVSYSIGWMYIVQMATQPQQEQFLEKERNSRS